MMEVPEEMFDTDRIVDQIIGEYDDTSMPLPDIENHPHLLISKVRKHYMEYLIKLLAVNYETNQKLLNKNIYLPSGIWRCAKNIETTAAQMCMVVHLYRQNIAAVVKELKNDTKNGKLNRKLYECLHTPPANEKKLQTSFKLTAECTCECRCKIKKKRRRKSQSPVSSQQTNTVLTNMFEQNRIPVLINLQEEQPIVNKDLKDNLTTDLDKDQTMQNFTQPGNLPNNPTRPSIESQQSDDVVIQLEKLFHTDPNDDDLFDGAYSGPFPYEDTIMKSQVETPDGVRSAAVVENTGSSILQNHSQQIKSLDERLASLAGLLAANTEISSTPVKPEAPKSRKPHSSRWLCEEYYMKSRLFELLDELGDTNRKKFVRVKATLLKYFGDDSDDDGLLSPLEETPEFVTSCKERIAPWVVKLLTPYYIKGRIRGKALFKALAKHLIRLIYQCSHYPSEYEVKSFVTDFLENHKMIRCEADFNTFCIQNY